MTPRLWAAVLKVCAVAGDHEQARRILERMWAAGEHNRPNIRHCTAYLKALVVAKQIQMAADFLEHLATNDTSERSTGTDSNSNSNSNSTTKAFSNIPASAPDMIAVKTVLSGCASVGDFNLAQRILGQVKGGLYGEIIQQQLDEQCYNLVLAACDEPQLAKGLVKEMRLSRRYRVGVIPPSKVTFTRAIAVCRKARDIESARFFLSSARNDGVDPDAFMYSAGT